MSLNKYDASTGELVTLANGQRIWVGTKAAHDAAEAAGTLPTNCLIAITDDGDITGVVDAVENGNMNPVTSNAVYNKFNENWIKKATFNSYQNAKYLTIRIRKSTDMMIRYRLSVSGYSASSCFGDWYVRYYPYNNGTIISPQILACGNSVMTGRNYTIINDTKNNTESILFIELTGADYGNNTFLGVTLTPDLAYNRRLPDYYTIECRSEIVIPSGWASASGTTVAVN